jgi:hypothetical protein
MKLYEKIQPMETCPYCKKNKLIEGKELCLLLQHGDAGCVE